MKIILPILFLFLFLINTDAKSQDFESAIGLRLGFPTSVTYKKFINETNAIEGYIGYRGSSLYNFTAISGAYQIHKDFEDVDRLQWYYGGGASVFFFSGFGGGSSTAFGPSGYIGLSYTLENTPINFSIDWVPTLFIGAGSVVGSSFAGSSGAIAVRYVLGS